MRTVLAALLLVLALGACSSDGGIVVRPPDVQVDTPELRAAKDRIGMLDCQPGSGQPVDGGLPDVTLPCLAGGPDVDLASLRGPMMINLWQARCEPCKREMPALEEFHQEYGEQVAVIGIDFNDVQPAAAMALAEETGITYPSIADPGGELMTQEAFAIARRGLPAFLFVDADGTVAGTSSGGVDSVAEVKDLVSEHLGISLD